MPVAPSSRLWLRVGWVSQGTAVGPPFGGAEPLPAAEIQELPEALLREPLLLERGWALPGLGLAGRAAPLPDFRRGQRLWGVGSALGARLGHQNSCRGGGSSSLSLGPQSPPAPHLDGFGGKGRWGGPVGDYRLTSGRCQDPSDPELPKGPFHLCHTCPRV